MTTEIRHVDVESLALLKDGSPAWSARLEVEFIDSEARPDALRSPDVRVLAQRAETQGVTAGGSDRERHEPLHYEASLGTSIEGWLKLGPYGGQKKLLESLERPGTVTLVPSQLLKDADPREMKMPGLVLRSGAIPVGIHARRTLAINRLWRLLGLPAVDGPDFGELARKGRIAIFGDESGGGSPFSIPVHYNAMRKRWWIEASLRPEGLAFDVSYQSPLDDNTAYRIAVCLTPDPATPMGLRLAPRPSHDLEALATRVQALMLKLRHGSPLLVDVAPAVVPRLGWRISSKDGYRLLAGPEIEIDRGAIAASLSTERVRGAQELSAAQLHADRAVLKRSGNGIELHVSGGTLAQAGVAVRLAWQAGNARLSGISVGSDDTSQAGRFDAVAETTDLQALLTERYRRGAVLGPDEKAQCAFLPLERGVLQLPLPRPMPQVSGANPPKPRQGFTGLVFARFPTDPGELQVTAASRFEAVLREGAGGSISFLDAVGTYTGGLWACEQTPTAAEILPTLEGGALATRPLRLVFGNPAVLGWQMRVDKVTDRPRGTIDFVGFSAGTAPEGDIAAPVAWLPHGEAAVVSVMPLTRTRPAASRASPSRDLLPHPLDLAAIRSNRPLRLAPVASSEFPTVDLQRLPLDLTHPFAKSFGKPEAEQGEDTANTDTLTFATLALPGVEVARYFDATPGPAVAATAISLRYDLPLLGELFATTTVPKPKPSGSGATPEASLEIAPTSLHPTTLAEHWRIQGNRHSLSRTMQDRVIGWRAPSTTLVEDVRNLIQPYSAPLAFAFSWRAANGLPIGQYTLAGQAQHGSTALAGLSTHAIINGVSLQLNTSSGIAITGFSPALYANAADQRVDYRGWGRQAATVTHPYAGGRSLEVREQSFVSRQADTGALVNTTTHAVTVDAIPVKFGPVDGFLRVRDLPMTRANSTPGRFEFDGAASTFESEVAPRGLALQAANAGRSLYEWSLGIDDAASFSIPIGPLRFRPLRLWKLAMAGTPAEASELCVVGFLHPPTQLAESRGIDDDQPYAQGTLVALWFSGGVGGTLALQAASRADIDKGKLTVTKDTPVAEFFGNAIVDYAETTADGDNDSARWPRFKLRFPVVFSGGVLQQQTTATLELRLFGQALALRGTASFDSGMRVDFARPGNPPERSTAFDVKRIQMTWADNDHPKLTITAQLHLAAGTDAQPQSPRLVSWTPGGVLQWLGIESGVKADFLRISHRHGSLAVRVHGLSAAGELLRGLPVNVNMPYAFSLAATFSPSNQPTPWPTVVLHHGFFSASLGESTGELRVRHTLETTRAGAEGWHSTCDVSLGAWKATSTVQWPLRAFTIGTRHGKGVTIDAVAASPSPYVHTLEATIEHVSLDVGTLARASGGSATYYINGGWRIPDFPMRHCLSDGNESFNWTSLDELVVADLQQLAEQCLNELDHPASGTYAFAPRYVGDVALNVKQPELIPRAGVLARAFARAGQPTWEISQALAQALMQARSQEPPRQLPASLVALGGATIEIATAPLAAQRAAQGITLGMPWIARFNAKNAIDVLDAVPQWGAQPTQMEVAAFDAANASPRELDVANPIPFAAGAGSHHEMRGRILALAREQFPGEHLPPRSGFMPVSQAVARSPEDERDWDPAAVRWLHRPVFWRSLLGWRGAADAIAAARVPGDEPPFQQRVATLVPFFLGESRARAGVLRLSVGAQGEHVPAQSEHELIVLAEEGPIHAPFPGELERLAASGSFVPDYRLATLARNLAPAPRVVAVARGLPTTEAPAKTVVQFAELGSEVSDFDTSESLRLRTRVLPASPALGWPRRGERLGLPLTGPRLGEQTPIQDARHAWAGEAMTFSLGARAWDSSLGTQRVAVVALSQRVAFRRPQDVGVLAPPDRALHPVPPRVRVPAAEAFQRALRSARLQRSDVRKPKDGEDVTDDTGIAPILPGHFETVVTGIRPGVPVFASVGLVLAADDCVVDCDRPVGGRAAGRGPVLWHHSRAPRSTALPSTPLDGKAWDLSRARRTYVATDEATGNELFPFFAVRRPMTLLRYDHGAQSGSIRFVVPDSLLAEPLSTTNWAGSLSVTVSAPGTATPKAVADLLAVEGLLAAASVVEVPAIVRLAVGGRSYPFAWCSWHPNTDGKRIDLVFRMEGTIAAQVLVALTVADADAPAFLSIVFGPNKQGVNAIADSKEFAFKQQVTELRPGPPTVLALPIPAEPSDRPSQRLPLATLAFGDPAYDRELASKTQSDTRGIRGMTYLLAADRREYDVTSSIYFQCGVIVAKPGEPVNWDALNPGAMYVQFEYIPFDPAGASRSAPLRVATANGAIAKGPYGVDGAHGLAIAALRLDGGDAGTPVEWRDGDRIAIYAWPQASGQTQPADSLSVRVTVVAEPVIAPPAAVYGFLTLDKAKNATENRPTAALFASAPLAQRLEFPDLSRDLALGHVRRRALFLWNFVPRRLDDGTERGCLVKVDRTGGGQLADADLDFRAIGE